MALSTAEAEYMALAATVCELRWYQMMIRELFNVKVQGDVLCDNQATIKLASNDGIHGRSKHIDIRHHFIRDHVRNKNIVVKFVSTKEQQADLLTKMLASNLFVLFREQLMSVC